MKATRKEYWVVVNKRTGEPVVFPNNKERFGTFTNKQAAILCMADHFPNDKTIEVNSFSLVPYGR